MPKTVRKKSAAKTSRNKKATAGKATAANTITRMSYSKSYTSLILGGIIVFVIGIVILSVLKIHRDIQTSSTSDFIKIEEEDLSGQGTSSTYTVRAGDDLWSISETAFNDGYKWVEIAKLNKLENPDKIYAGEKLMMPAKSSSQKAAPANNNVGASIGGGSYTVVKGDCLWNIAVRAYGDGFKWTEIAKANGLVNPSIIHSGNKLILPR